MTPKHNLPVPYAPAVTGTVERVTKRSFFDMEEHVVEPCEECGGMHDRDVLTLCVLQRAKRVLTGGGRV